MGCPCSALALPPIDHSGLQSLHTHYSILTAPDTLSPHFLFHYTSKNGHLQVTYEIVDLFTSLQFYTYPTSDYKLKGKQKDFLMLLI